MKNDEVMRTLQHVTEVSHGHTITADHLNSLKMWVRLEEEKADGLVVGVLIAKNLIAALETCRQTLPLHEATDSTPVASPTPPRRTRKPKAVVAASPEPVKDAEGEASGTGSSQKDTSQPVIETPSASEPAESPAEEVVAGTPAAEVPAEPEPEEEPVLSEAPAGQW